MFKRFIQRLLDIHPNALSFKQGLDLTGLPVVTFYQGDEKLNFILDTGSDVSVIDCNALPKIKHTILDNIKGSLYGIDGKRVKVEVCTITLEYKDNTYTHNYLVKDLKEPFSNVKHDHGVTLHGLLGSRFFNEFRYVLDFSELIAYSKQ